MSGHQSLKVSMSQDKYNLRWHTYSDHLTEMMQDMLSDEFADVTLVCDDKKTIKAHRNILSVCSPVFKDIFRMQPQKPQPVIYLRGIQYSELECILQFIYSGETKFHKERLNEFLSVSKNLEIRELSKNDVNPSCDEKTDLTITEEQAYNFNSESYAEHEVKDKEIETKFHCSECDKSFSYTSDLYRHLSLHIQKTKNAKHEVEEIETKTKFQCSKCDKSFSFKSDLYRHKRSVHEGVKFECNLCDYEASRQDNMSIHIQTKHAEHDVKDKEIETKFHCTECSKSFSYKTHLHRHRRSAHKGIKYECNLCEYEGSRQDNLTIHIQTKHEGLKYACNQCDYEATTNGNLTHHVKSEHEGVRYSCNLCEYQAKQQSQLKTHKKHKH